MTEEDDERPVLKADLCDYQCRECHRPFHTYKGLQIHRERIHGR